MNQAASEPVPWLAYTRLRPPQQHDIVPRERVQVLLRAAVEQRRLTLLAAPAGAGKTTLLAELPQLFPELPLAWLSLDVADDAPARFLAALIAALARLHPSFGAGTRALLTTRASPGDEGAYAQTVTTALINDIEQTLPDPFLLVLDDLHLIESPTVYLALDQLIAQMPAQMRLLIATRRDPPLSLARLRARRQMTELRLAELRFRDDEAQALLTQLLSTELSLAEVSAIQARTEGWGAGLCLLAASLQGREAPATREQLLDTLAHTDRYLFEFLADEVLTTLPQHLQAFLVETAVLHELTPAHCCAVTERDDAAAVLDELYRRNLFLSIVSDEQRASANALPGTMLPAITYRYHALFRAFLLQRLAQRSAPQVAELHRRAAEAQPGSEQAIEHYLAAQLWQPAADAIGQVGGRLLPLGQLEPLRRWIAAIPASVADGLPALLYLDGLTTMLQGNLRDAEPLLQRARQRAVEQGNTHVEGGALGALASCAYWQGDFSAMEGLVEAALARPIQPGGRVQLLLNRAAQSLLTGDWQPAAVDLDAALAVATPVVQPYLCGVVLFHLTPWFAVLPGRLAPIERFCAEAALIIDQSFSPSHLALLKTQAALDLWHGRLDQAIDAGEAVIARKAQLGGHPFLIRAAYVTLADAYVARGDYAEAERCLVALFRDVPPAAQLSRILAHYAYARLYLLQGRAAEAREQATFINTSGPTPTVLTHVAHAILDGLHAQRDGQLDVAEQSLQTAIAWQQQTPVALLMGNARVLLARLFLDQGRVDAALDELQPVLADYAQTGLAATVLLYGELVVPLLQLAIAHGVAADVAAQLLHSMHAAYQVATPASPVPPAGYQAIPGAPELLSPREVEVLQLMIDGASNRAIAEALVISDATAKTHVAHILQKLGVSSRLLAVARARELGLG